MKTFSTPLQVAAVFVVLVVTAGCGAGTDAGLAPADETRSPQVLGTAALDLDVGPASDAAAVEECVGGGFAPDADSVEVLYAVEQRTEDGSTPVLILRNGDGDIRLCDVMGADRPATLPLPEPSDSEPVTFLANGQAAWDCEGNRLQGYTSTTWLAVGDDVDRVQQRFSVDGAPEPWFTTQAQDGYAHLQTWLSGSFPRQTEITVEYRVLDASGEPVSQSALPSGEQELENCAGGGDAQIG